MSRVLVTGHTGMIGNYVVKFLDEYGADVLKYSRGMLNIKPAEYNVGAILHLAAYTDVANSHLQPMDVFKSNVELTYQLTDLAVRLNVPMIHVSTIYIDALYESRLDRPKFDFYTYTKALAEDVIDKRQVNNLKIIRTGNIFGVNKDGQDHKLAGKIIERAKRGERIFQAANMIVRPTYAKDFANHLAELIVNPHLIHFPKWSYFLNARGKHPVTLKDYMSFILDTVGIDDYEIDEGKNPVIQYDIEQDTMKRRGMLVEDRLWTMALKEYLQETKM